MLGTIVYPNPSICLRLHEIHLIEKAVYKNSSSDISLLLDGCSYEEIVIPKIRKSINLKKSYNAVILIYNFVYNNEISSSGAFDFIATTNYE